MAKKAKDEKEKKPLPELPKTDLVAVTCTGNNGDCDHPLIARSPKAMQDARADHIAYVHTRVKNEDSSNVA